MFRSNTSHEHHKRFKKYRYSMISKVVLDLFYCIEALHLISFILIYYKCKNCPNCLAIELLPVKCVQLLDDAPELRPNGVESKILRISFLKLHLYLDVTIAV